VAVWVAPNPNFDGREGPTGKFSHGHHTKTEILKNISFWDFIIFGSNLMQNALLTKVFSIYIRVCLQFFFRQMIFLLLFFLAIFYETNSNQKKKNIRL